jgi:hypothetical protein
MWLELGRQVMHTEFWWRPFLRKRWRITLREIYYEDRWIDLTQDFVQWQALVLAVVNLLFCYDGVTILLIYCTVMVTIM